MVKTQPTTTFPHLLSLHAVPHTIMNVYSETEKQELFGTTNTMTTTPTVRAISYHRQNQSQQNHTLNSIVPARCHKCCFGISYERE